MGIQIKMPDPPLIAAGAIGGPCVMFAVTPLRNALTYGAIDPKASFSSLYRKSFGTRPFAGGHYMAIAACPGFLVLGPVFHIYNGLVDSSAAACVLTGVTETVILYGSETRNAQVAYNNSFKSSTANAAKRTSQVIAESAMQNVVSPLGPGNLIHITRNIVAMSGLRVFSQPCQRFIESIAPSISKDAKQVTGDFIANVGASILTAPMHQAYSFCCTERYADPKKEGGQVSAITQYLKRQYLTESGKISRIAARDVALRICYNATLFTMFGCLERACVAFWPR